ncbi:MAG: flavodoxin domain-containing protein [Acetatifactor sp.]
MKQIVIYQSGTGFTAKYAGWIAEELGCEAKEYKNVSQNELTAFDMVVYGGWIMGGMIVGYDKIKALNLKNVVVFGVGMSFPDDEVTEKISNQNQLPRDRFFYFEGGYNPQKLGIVKKMMLNMIKKSVEKKTDKTAQEVHLLKSFEGADNTSKEAISGLVAYCRSISS